MSVESLSLLGVLDEYAGQVEEATPSANGWPGGLSLGPDRRNTQAWAYVYDANEGYTATVVEDVVGHCGQIATGRFGILIPETTCLQDSNRTILLVRHVPRFISVLAFLKREDLELAKNFSNAYKESLAPSQPFIPGLYHQKDFGHSYPSEEERHQEDAEYSAWWARKSVAEMFEQEFSDPEPPKTPPRPMYLVGIGNICL